MARGSLIAPGILVAALSLLFLILSAFHASARSLSRIGQPVPGDQAPRTIPHRLPAFGMGFPRRLALAVQAARQGLLVLAALGLARIFMSLGFRWSGLWAFAVTFVLLSLVIEQGVARSLALLWPGTVCSITYLPARIISAPALPFVEPFFKLLSLLRGLLGSAGRGEGHPAAPLDGPYGAEEETPLRVAERELIDNVVEFSGTLVREVMTPRTEMVTVEETAPLSDLVARVVGSNHSRIPITRGGADQVVGMVHARDLLALWDDSTSPRRFSGLVRPIISVPETKRALELLRDMQGQGLQMAIVVDEYGGTAGLVTVEDLLEELVGEIADEHEVRGRGLQRQPDGSYLVRGSYTLSDLAGRLGMSSPDVEADSIGGLVAALLGRLPEAGERVEIAGFSLEVVEADRKRVRLVRVRPSSKDDPDGGPRREPGGQDEAAG